jgi:hypothetical protein
LVTQGKLTASAFYPTRIVNKAGSQTKLSVNIDYDINMFPLKDRWWQWTIDVLGFTLMENKTKVK